MLTTQQAFDLGLSMDTTEAIRGLSPDLQDVALDLMFHSKAAVARRLGLTRGQLATAVRKIRAAFKAAGVTL